jgi:hypothetical protein
MQDSTPTVRFVGVSADDHASLNVELLGVLSAAWRFAEDWRVLARRPMDPFPGGAEA